AKTKRPAVFSRNDDRRGSSYLSASLERKTGRGWSDVKSCLVGTGYAPHSGPVGPTPMSQGANVPRPTAGTLGGQSWFYWGPVPGGHARILPHSEPHDAAGISCVGARFAGCPWELGLGDASRQIKCWRAERLSPMGGIGRRCCFCARCRVGGRLLRQ